MQPATLGQRYRVLREISRGGMGVVYEVEHLATGRRHAAKVLMQHLASRPASIERFMREVRAPVQIDSEHVVEVTDAGEAPELGGAPFLVMELLEGCDLRELVRQRSHLAPAEVVSLLGQIAGVLDRAHAAGIVHRDLKPSNVFLHRRRDGTTVVKLFDFGLATAVGCLEERQLTMDGAVMGTPYYMAPEQARGDRGATGPTTDLFSIGLMAFELLTGQAYWAGAKGTEIMHHLLGGTLPPASQLVPGLPPGFDAWLARSCHVDPRQRWQRAGEQLAALAHVLGVPSPSPGLTPSLMLPALPQRSGPPPTWTQQPSSAQPSSSAPQPWSAQPSSGAPQPWSAQPSLGVPQPWQPPPSGVQTSAGFVKSGAPSTPASPARTIAVVAALLFAVGGGALGVGAWLGSVEAPRRKKQRVAATEDNPPPPPPPAPVTAAPTPSIPPKPPGPRVTTVDVFGADDGYDGAAIRTVESHFGDIEACYSAALARAPLKGDLTLMISLDTTGRVTHTMCAQDPPKLFDQPLCTCIAGRSSEWRFPPTTELGANFFYTVRLEP